MKKYYLLFVAAAIGLFASCTEDIHSVSYDSGESTVITVNAPVQKTATRAGSTEFADPALSNMRVALIISTEDNHVITVETKTHSFGTGTTPCTFEARLYKGKTYNISVWADYGASYYTIPTQPTTTAEAESTLPIVKMASTTITGSDNKYDAYFGNTTTSLSDNGNINVQLSRPFALVKVNTTDWDENAVKLASYRPDNYATTFKAPTQLNLVSGVADDAQFINTTASIVAYDQDGTTKELHYDYLLANTTSSILPDFTVAYKQSTTTNSTYIFKNIPVQRNYKTDITGNILTKKGKINVTITPDWEETTYQMDVKDIQGANDAIQQNVNAGNKNIDINFTEEPNDAGSPGTSGARAILTTNLLEGSTLNINVESETKELYIGDYTDENSTTVQTSGTKTAEVNINIPAGSKIETLVINAPSKTVYINGKNATNVGTITNLDVITSDNTLVIEKGQTVTNLTIRQGAVKIFGTVTNVQVIPTSTTEQVVFIRDCEGLSQSVYDVLAPYIDIDNGYAGVQDGELWNIVKGAATVVAKIGQQEYYTLKSAFMAAQDNQTIELQTDYSLNATITVGKSITLDLMNYSLTVACPGYAFDLNTQTSGKTFTIKGSDKDNCAHIVSNGTSGHSGVACINANSTAVTFEMNAVKVHGATEADAYNAGSVIISDNSNERGDLIKLTDVSIRCNQDIVSGSDGRAYASIDVRGGVYNSTNRGFRFCGAASSSSVVDGADITTAGGIAVYAFSIATLKNSVISMTSSSNNDAVACSRKYNNDAVLTIEDTNITVTTGSGSKLPVSAIASEDKGVVVVKSGTFENKNASTYVVKVSTTGGVINFQGGTVLAQDGQTTMFANTQSGQDDSQNPSKINITGGTIYGNCGVSSDNARVEINGGTFKDAITLHVQSSQHVSIMPGSTAVFEGKVTSTQTSAVNIPAGTFKKAIAEGDLKAGSTITDGTFYEAAPYAGYIDSGYAAVAQGTSPETWKIIAKTPANASTTSFGDWK